MEIPDDILKLIEGSEKITIEYKKSFDEEGIKESMLSFANSQGGKILVGIKEVFQKDGYQKGEIEGLKHRNIDNDKETVYNFSLNTIPTIKYNFNEYSFLNNDLIYVITIYEAKEKPSCTRKGLYKIRGHKGNNGIFPDMMRSIIFSEKERLILLKRELMVNKSLTDRSKSDFINNRRAGYTISFSRYKLTSLISFMNTPSKFYFDNYLNLEGLYHDILILNKLLDNLPIFALMSASNYDAGHKQYITGIEEVISNIQKIIKLIDDRIEDLSN